MPNCWWPVARTTRSTWWGRRGTTGAGKRAGEGFGAEDFAIDWDRQQATCPEGCVSVEWKPCIDNRGNDSIYISAAAR